uniref:Selenide, water dikinase n=1 Tax=Bicosoecida sp. CB-2014 TaxID=1486930 RepID=A0A7S1CND3_9STRA|mmetsp:Transcript_7184/g.25655  ORF Transcript_7184/g.25655 Transcript_7184/m.25655 type:complete len:306 (+) Transcript_7184:429-1346(+)
MDCSVVDTRHPGMYLVSTTDFFYPLVEDPYLQGRVACCNVLSDLYAMGVVECDTMLMILAASTKMSGPERDVVTTLMIKGFSDCAREAGTSVTGGQTVLNPWPIIGGVAKSVCAEQDMIRPGGARVGDAIVLTKPLGTQVAVNAQEWRHSPKEWAKISDVVTEDEVALAFGMATESMCRLNINGARMMHKHGAHAATDVTGFGILGHLTNLARETKEAVSMELHTLPILAKMLAVEEKRHCMFRLMEGYSAETSGGLMVCLPAENAQAFVDELSALDGQPAWIIGRVVAGDNTARILPSPTVIEV